MASPSIDQEFRSQGIHLLEQSMVKIRHCLQQLDEAQIWWRPAESLNSIGNLLLHLSGNLRQWAVAGVGGQPDLRERQTEFDQRESIPGDDLLAQLEQTVKEAKQVIDSLTSELITSKVSVQGFSITALEAIMHTTSHFVGHTHQIILLARMQLGSDYRFQWSPESDRTDVPI